MQFLAVIFTNFNYIHVIIITINYELIKKVLIEQKSHLKNMYSYDIIESR